MNNLITWKQRLNEVTFETETYSKFLTFYIQLLLYVHQTFGQISELQVENINQLIQKVIWAKADENPCTAQNLLYSFNAYLCTMSNSDAFEKLESISSIPTANQMIDEVSNWLDSVRINLLTNLDKNMKNIQIFQNENAYKAYKSLRELCKSLHCGNPTSFAQLHKVYAYLELKTFSLSKPSKIFSNYIENVIATVEAFSVELSIMIQLKGSDIINWNKELIMKKQEKFDKILFSIESKYDKALEELKQQYQAKVQRAQEIEQELDKITEKMTDEELDEFFDSSNPLVKESCNYDVVKLKQEYTKTKEKILSQKDSHLDTIKKSQSNSQTVFDFDFSQKIPRLRTIIYEYALFIMAEKQIIDYPTTMDEKLKYIKQIKYTDAIKIVLLSNHFSWNEKEQSYLKSIM